MRIQWTQEAVNDLDSIYYFIALQNARAAIKIYNAILEEVEILKTFPCVAPIEPLLDNQPECFRGWVVFTGKFKVIYYIEEDSVYITHIWDCRQDPEILKQQLKNR